MIYDTDDEAQMDWDEERLAFQAGGFEEDLQLDAPLPTRFWIDVERGLPRVRDRLYHDQVVAHFLTLKEAESYQMWREVGCGHWEAMGKVAS